MKYVIDNVTIPMLARFWIMPKMRLQQYQSIVQCLSKLPLATMQTTSFSPLAIHEQFAHIPTTLGKYH